MLNLSNFYPKIKGLFYVVNPTPVGVGDLKSENPGVPGGGGLRLSWGFPNPNRMRFFLENWHGVRYIFFKKGPQL